MRFKKNIFCYTPPKYTVEKTSIYNNTPILSIIIPVYNKEKFLTRCIQSVINQTLGMNNIELLLIDDLSTDSSEKIMMNLIKQDTTINVSLIRLNKNTGSPSTPRNIGIDLAKGKYTMFLDADDFLSSNGCKSLVDLLEESGDFYAIGKTLRIEDNKDTLIGEYNNYKKQINVDVVTAPKVFQHLGPTARIVLTSLIKENKLYFPDLQYSEDKLFFLQVLIYSKTISKSPDLIYYVNRTNENNGSLVGRTTIFEKMNTNIIALKYILSQKYELAIEKKLVARLVEFDSLTRLFNRAHFVRSTEKEKYYECFDEIIAICDKLPYSYEEFITSDLNKNLYRLCSEKKYNTLEQTIHWYRFEKNKQLVVKDNVFYHDSGIPDVDLFRIPMKVSVNYHFKNNGCNYLSLTVFGDSDLVDGLQLRNRSTLTEQINIPYTKKIGNIFEFVFEDSADYSIGKYLVYLMYNGYEKTLIQQTISFDNKDKIGNKLYTTVNGNLGAMIHKSVQ